MPIPNRDVVKNDVMKDGDPLDVLRFLERPTTLPAQLAAEDKDSRERWATLIALAMWNQLMTKFGPDPILRIIDCGENEFVRQCFANEGMRSHNMKTGDFRKVFRILRHKIKAHAQLVLRDRQHAVARLRRSTM